MEYFKGAAIVTALFLFVAAAGCGGGGGADETVVAPDQSAPAQNDLEAMVYGDAYAGKLVVKFDEALKVRLQDVVSTDKAAVAIARPRLVSIAGGEAAVQSVQTVLDAHPVATIARSTTSPEDQVEKARLRLERLSGKPMPDWNSLFRIDAPDRGDAVLLMRELAEQPGVKYVYPQMRPKPASLDTTPSLVSWQAYLNAEDTHGGLNAYAAWSAGITGQDVIVVDNEPGMNFDHEDLQPLVKDDTYNGGNFLYQPDCAPGFPYELPDCEVHIAHGAAVAGILIARDNGHGVTGFAHGAFYVQGSMDGSVSGDLSVTTDGVDDPTTHGDDDIEPGTIWVLEVQLAGKYADLSCTDPTSATCQYGYVPVELWPDPYDAIQQATAYGVTVIEAAGNGTMNLNNPELYTGAWTFAHNMATDDAGSIMVGASEGANEEKISFSNCGTRLNSFAWGQGVVTTGYPYGPYAWNGATAPVPPNETENTWFVNMFGGTSSAAAMVGGAATLVQSYARDVLGHKRYLMPSKMRTIIVDSGVVQADTSGCNIGTQPRIDQAMTLVDTFLTQVYAAYPQVLSGEQMTETEMLSLRSFGVGIICKKYDPVNSDPLCPDSEIFPEGMKLARTYDIDGDDRADLVKFVNGTWSVDLSGTGTTEDKFGAWDLVLAFPAISGSWVWPYVEDMNSDGRADFVAYDKEHGEFYVALTDLDLTRNGVWHGWDWVLDYSSQWHDELMLDPADSSYSRPALGNYNGDEWADIGIYCSDGHVRVDYGAGTEASFAGFEWNAQLVTDAMLALAPGWAYLVTAADFSDGGRVQFTVKVPDGLPDEGKMHLIPQDGVNFLWENDWMMGSPAIFGGNDTIPMLGAYIYSESVTIGIKEPDGKWRATNDAEFATLTEIPPSDIFEDQDCHPVTGDFDGDGKSDRVVMCPTEWRIAYSGSAYAGLMESGYRVIGLTYNKNTFALPGRTYSGGISYAYTQQLIEMFQAAHPGVPPPILVDMVTVAVSP